MRVIFTFLIVLALGAGGFWAYQNLSTVQSGGTAGNSARSIESDIQFLTALRDSTPAESLSNEADYLAFADAVADFTTVSFGSFQAEGAGVVANNVVFADRTNSDVGSRIEELRIYGFNSAAVSDFKNGNGPLTFNRLDARGIEWYGMEILSHQILESYINMIEGVVAEMSEGDVASADVFSQNIEKYELGAGQVVIDGMTLHSISPATVEEGIAQANFMELLRVGAHWARATSIDASATYDLFSSTSIEQMGQKSKVTMKMPFVGNRDYRFGDLGRTVATDFSYEMDMEIPSTPVAENGPAVSAPFSMKMAASADLYAISELNLSKIYDYFIRNQMPPTTETNLLSLGVWQIEGERYEIGGEPFYSVGKTVIDLSSFHWFVPTKISSDSKGIVYNIEGLMSYMNSMMSMSGSATDQDAQQLTTQALEILREHDLAALRMDFNLNSSWNPEDGDGQSVVLLDINDIAALEYNGAAMMPTFGALSTFVPAEEGAEVDWSGLLELTRERAALRSLSLAIEDKGGLDKGYALTVAFSKLAPEDPNDMANVMLRNADPLDLRISNAAMVRMMAPQLAQTMPAAQDYLIAVADFIQKGGMLRAEANPPRPVTLQMMEYESIEIEADPNRLVEVFGISVTHESPRDAENLE